MSSKILLKNIQLLTFDVHNVLLTVRKGAPYQYARLAKECFKISSVDETKLQTNFIQAFRQFNHIHPGYGVNTNITSRQWWNLVVEYAFKDAQLTSEQSQKLGRIIYDEFARGDLWVKNPQADRVLNYLKPKKLLGVISNFDERLESLLEQHQLRDYFQFILTPRTCGFYKPQKEIFDHAAKQGNIRTNEYLCHIGDDLKLDYLAARNANCQALLLNKNNENSVDKSHVIKQLDDLLNLF